MTIEALGADMLDLVPDLLAFVPPANVLDKRVYSPWTGTNLNARLREIGIDTLIISGGETDVCVLATVLGAIDWGFRVIVVHDAVFGSADATHEATQFIYASRFGEQIETISTELILRNWG